MWNFNSLSFLNFLNLFIFLNFFQNLSSILLILLSNLEPFLSLPLFNYYYLLPFRFLILFLFLFLFSYPFSVFVPIFPFSFPFSFYFPLFISFFFFVFFVFIIPQSWWNVLAMILKTEWEQDNLLQIQDKRESMFVGNISIL